MMKIKISGTAKLCLEGPRSGGLPTKTGLLGPYGMVWHGMI